MIRHVFAALLCALCVSGFSQSYTAIGKYEESDVLAMTRKNDAKSSDELQRQYQAAIKDAEYAEPSEISRDLTAIVPWEKGLIWRGEGESRQVLLVTWTSYKGYDNLVGTSTTLTREVWTVLANQLQDFVARHHQPYDSMVLRLEQLLGQPPNVGKTRFVEMWVNPDDVFRPSPDPEYTDHESELDFPRSPLFVMVSQAHKDWIYNLESVSYLPTGYPWTRLGYTYDWKRGAKEVGLSEYVIHVGSAVEIKDVIPNAEYFDTRPNKP